MIKLSILTIFLSLISCNVITTITGEQTKPDNDFFSSNYHNSDGSPFADSFIHGNLIQDTETIINLNYTDQEGDLAYECFITSTDNVIETSSCTCDTNGNCFVGVTGNTSYTGAAGFSYTVTTNGQSSNTAYVDFNIDPFGINCPTGFIPVIGNSGLGTSDFCVMQFEAKNSGGTPISQPTLIPWVSISAIDAQAECETMSEVDFNGEFTLISNPEWMTIARNIENEATNWSNGVVGSGHIIKGHSDSNPNNPLTVTNTADPYDSTGNSSGETPGAGWEQARRHILSNGSEIWDFGGNVYEWVDWDPSDGVYTTGPVDVSIGYKELTAALEGSISYDDLKPSIDVYNSTNSFGQWYGGTGGAALRSGSFNSGINGGVFTLVLNSTPAATSTAYGFRCVYRP